MDAAPRQDAAATLAVASSAALVVLKLVVGLCAGSVAVIAAAAHSAVALVAAVVALAAVGRATPPPAEHPHGGRGPVEVAAATVEALLIFLAAAWLIYEAVTRLVHPEPIDAAGWGMGVMLLAAAASLGVARRLRSAGHATGSLALEAGARHQRTDAYAAAGVGATLGLVLVGRAALPGRGVAVLDPLAAIAVALVTIRAAWALVAVSRDGASGT